MKQSLREKYFKIRSQKEDPEKASNIIIQKILDLNEFANAKSIFLYFDITGEVHIRPLIVKCWELGKRTYFPLIEEVKLGEVKDWSEFNEFLKNDKLFHEPINTSSEFNIDLAIIPGVAFDKKGVRLGSGSGWFDKFFSEHKDIYKIGVCYKEQLTDSLPQDSHDILMDLVITD